MSLELSNSGKIECKAYPKEILNGVIRVGNHEISPDDFCSLVMYFMINTDLAENDPRMELREEISNLIVTEGYSSGEWRLKEKE
jgi:hypothetical protein